MAVQDAVILLHGTTSICCREASVDRKAIPAERKDGKHSGEV